MKFSKYDGLTPAQTLSVDLCTRALRPLQSVCGPLPNQPPAVLLNPQIREPLPNLFGTPPKLAAGRLVEPPGYLRPLLSIWDPAAGRLVPRLFENPSPIYLGPPSQTSRRPSCRVPPFC